MNEASSMSFEPMDVDILGRQAIMSQLYTQVTLCFPLTSGEQSAVISKLEAGLEVLVESFPWVAGHVVRDPTPKIVPYKAIPEMVVKQCKDISYAELKSKRFPMSMLHEDLIAPRKTIAPGEEVYPVFVLQANFVNGGLLLTVNGLHSCMDMVGQGLLILWLHKACIGEVYTEEEIKAGSMDRGKTFELIEGYAPGPELYRQIKNVAPHVDVTPEGAAPAEVTPPECRWEHYSFSPEALTKLKSEAAENLPEGAAFVSTDDALSGFIWKHISHARLHRVPESEDTTFARSVDVRKHMGISSLYPGLIQNMTYHTFPLSTLSSLPLGHVAANLRATLTAATQPENKGTELDLAFRTRALATAVHNAPADGTQLINVTATLDLNKDLMLSSWAKEKCYDCNFGLGLGNPEAVRRPSFVPVESLIYFLPRRSDGEIGVALCLRVEDLENLKKDQEWAKHAEHIG